MPTVLAAARHVRALRPFVEAGRYTVAPAAFKPGVHASVALSPARPIPYGLA